uniref:Phenoloxidase-activating factor 2 n=1 Tax=Megaselia scalaris TaxID=36166 RepID=T1GQQ3_MEGSC
MMQNKMKNQNHCETPYSIHGTCQTMNECKIPEIEGKSFNAIEHLCVLGGKQIGVCCPDSFKAPTNHRINHINKLYNKDVSRVVNSSIRPEQRGCGISARQFPKIIGARAVDPEEWPWMVAITRKGHPAAWCGGSLITDRHILTAAHCIDKFKPKDLIVRLGEYNFKQLNETRFRDFNISAMVHHVDYDPSTYENDIALMRIEQPALFNSYIWPVCMPPLGEIWHNYTGFITGWGTQHFSGPFSNILKEVNVPIWDLSSCRKKFVERLSDNMICAGDENGDSCQHDSGGPLMVQLPNRDGFSLVLCLGVFDVPTVNAQESIQELTSLFLGLLKIQAYAESRTKRQSGSLYFPDDQQLKEERCKTPYGQDGTCKQVSSCPMPQLKNNIEQAIDHLCIIDGKQIGVCCPDSFKPETGPRFDSISNAYNQVSKSSNNMNRPEERGCGITTRQFPKITGERTAEPDEWPWMVAITRKGYPAAWCGGALITDRHILTAAHCIDKFKVADLEIRLGEYNFKQSNETRSRDFRIAAMVTHVDYNPLNYENDIALIRIEKPTIFNSYVWPACMPPLGAEWESMTAIVLGWGTQHFGGPFSNILKEVDIPIWKLSKCREVFVERINDNMICAGREEGGADSCQGDSGGPLLIQLPNRRWVVVGVVSWGIRCGEKNRPGLYTRVDKYIQWIIDNSNI